MQPFDESLYYRPNDPAVTQFWQSGTLANMRAAGRGPAYIKLGGRILYSGRDLNQYLTACRVEPSAA